MDPCSRAKGALATWVALTSLIVAGCASKSSRPDGGLPDDGAAEHPTVSQCQCTADTATLTVDWACYCALHDCTLTEQQFGCETGVGTWTRGCGFDEYTVDTAGGPEIWVFDETGKQVGAQVASDTSPYVCPTNAGLQRFQLGAGQFRPDTCQSTTSCTCANLDAGQPCSGPI
jgi:hypothetical protein